ncbi:MAG: DUF4256 domain-containing protein [Candidatus Gracilibacteria bacterium]|jgi:hypothetical protein
MRTDGPERRTDPSRLVLPLEECAARALNRVTGEGAENIETAVFGEGERMRGLVRERLARLKELENVGNGGVGGGQNEEGKKVPVAEAKVRELSPEQAETTLRIFEIRFRANMHLHEGVDFERVKRSLEANPEALWSIAQMEAKGHKPGVYNDDENGFDVGTCVEESPLSARGCVYDKAKADWLRENSPKENFNGSAVEMAQEMGIDLMDPTLYKEVLQRKGEFDLQTFSWLLTPPGIRSTGDALDGDRRDSGVYVSQNRASNHNAYRAFRGSLRVAWKA